MISVKSLRVDYEEVNAVNDLSFEVKEGQIYGLVGPNGAGKTSTIKALAGIIEPTYGEIFINGIDMELSPQKALRHIGFMPDFSPVYDNLKVWEYLDVFAAGYLIDSRERPGLIKYWADKVKLTEKYNTFVKELSRGMKQRLVLAKTLLPEPGILLLDEPSSGLDPVARKDMRDVLKEVAATGKAVLISSHILTELSEFCNAIGIMEKGRMVISGSISEIRNRLKSKGLLTIKLNEPSEDNINRIYGFLKSSELLSDLNKLSHSELQARFHSDSNDASWILAQLVKQNIPVAEFFIKEDSVEDIFFKVGAHDIS
ncbi:MAG: ABC transporter ATP-binding protein [Candidatus Omnitrophica bacterium]|nr:ABC transporter ATP-binding protein [Candidatus Omnitrophota bacterium]